MPPPPPPPGSPPPELMQPRCINPPPVQMIDFSDAPPMLPFRASGSGSTPSNTPSSNSSGMPSAAFAPATPPPNGGNNTSNNSNHNLNVPPPPPSGPYRAAPIPSSGSTHMRSHHHSHQHHYHHSHSQHHQHHSQSGHLPPSQSIKKSRREGYRDSPHAIETIGSSGSSMRHTTYDGGLH